MEAEERPVKGRDVEENGRIDNGVNSSRTTDVKHAIEVWVSIAIAVVAIASQFALFEGSSITGDIAHVLFLSAVMMGMTAIVVYASEHGRNANGNDDDDVGDGVYRSVMICSMAGMWCVVFGVLAMTWAIRPTPVAAFMRSKGSGDDVVEEWMRRREDAKLCSGRIPRSSRRGDEAVASRRENCTANLSSGGWANDYGRVSAEILRRRRFQRNSASPAVLIGESDATVRNTLKSESKVKGDEPTNIAEPLKAEGVPGNGYCMQNNYRGVCVMAQRWGGDYGVIASGISHEQEEWRTDSRKMGVTGSQW
ncbi:hypothetical protein BD410DRAFT_810187 [Rickenella mellea]|uniref:Uncharacterized protein n=1 Tax=Rickenella mellea TaxID=50990 RepID=A0A4Y7PEX2_9AGAM|nr:hypothetical protein BD410DRAFT_810187 [Rickenella mellea]